MAGYDSIIIEGVSDKPVYLYVEDEYVKIRDASHLWGMDTRETTKALKKELGEDFRIACIGQAGEKLSRLACIFSDDFFTGRGGAGAVMGYKKLKAVAVKGTGSVEIADKNKFFEYKKAVDDLRTESYTWGPVHGYETPAWLAGINEYGLMPTKDFIYNQFDKIDELIPTNLWNNRGEYKVNRKACYSCQIGCRKYVFMGDNEVRELEFETISALGPRCGVSSLEDIALAAYYASIYGIDTISAGATVSAAMEWYEKGILTKEEVDGLELNFGNGKTMVELIRKMGLREGAGQIFADGSYYASLKLGGNTMDYTMHVKKMEISATDPRGGAAMTIAFGTSERGACHMSPYAATINAFGYILLDLGINEPKNPFDERECKGWHKAIKEYLVVTNLLGTCHFNVINTEISPTILAGIYSSVTDIQTDKYELLRKAERTIAIERAINYKRGFRRKDDCLPERFLNEPASFGPLKVRTIDMDTALDMFYDACSFDKGKAIPTPEKFAELGMEDITEKL